MARRRPRSGPIPPAAPAPVVSCLDVSLVMAVEQARYRQTEFSDSHWANLLLASYRSACERGPGPLVAALADILQIFCRNSTAAKAKAADYAARGCPLPSWIKLPANPQWRATCRTIQSRGIKFGPNGEFLCLLGDGD